jgi:hypothetical protein
MNKCIISLVIILFIMSCYVTSGQLPDIKVAERYGLVIPKPDEDTPSVPEWLQKADMFTWGSDLWKDYKFTLKDTVMTRIVRIRERNNPIQVTEHYPVETISSFDGSLVKGVSLISHIPHSKKAVEEAHKQGFKVIPYVHFTDIHSFYADQDVFLFQHPEILLKDAEGKWAHIPMDGSDRAFRFLTCSNSPSYWKLSLSYIKKMMDMGSDGIFIDNVDNRDACMAPKFDGRNPEFPAYIHEHLFPDSSCNYAWDRMLQTIRVLVKSYGDDKIVILNSGIDTQLQKNSDCCMWESFIYSWAWDGRNQTWNDVKERAHKNAWYLNSGKRITALSTINASRKEAKDDAFWAFSAARLVDFIWWAALNGSGAEILYQAHMGKGLEPFRESNGIAYRAFENGIIVLNNSSGDQNVELKLPVGFQITRVRDIYDGSRIIEIRNKKIRVNISKATARVYLSQQSLKLK